MESLPADYLEVWVAGDNVPLIRFADQVRALADTQIDLLGLPDVEAPRRLIEHLRSFDSIVSWYGSNRPEFRAAVTHLGLPFCFLRALPETGSKVHAADFFLEQVRGMAGTARDPVPRIGCPRGKGDFAVIHPFSGSVRKNWPLENFRQAAVLLSRQLPVHWCAGPRESLEGAVRIANLYELACWLASARVYIGNDSGITHLAAAAGVPVVALMGPTDPAVWGPRGPAVRILPFSSSPQEVAEAAQELACRFSAD